MTAKLIRFSILTLIIACFLFSNSVHCLQEIKAVVESTNTILPTGLYGNFVPNQLDKKDHKFTSEKNGNDDYYYDKDERRKDHDDDDEDEDDRESRKDLRKDRFENKSGRKYHKHDNKFGSDTDDNSHDDDSDDNRKKHKSTPSNTVVTTIIIVATETPTSIYSGTVNPAKQKGTGNANHQVSDPNSNSSNNGNNSDESTDASLTSQLQQDQSAYRKLVLALSIVGGLAGLALITGILIFTRMRVRKRKRKQATSDLEMAESSNDNNAPPPSPAHYRAPSPPPKARYSTMSDDGDLTVIDFNQNPFMDPSATLVGSKNMVRENRPSVLDNNTSLPPALPVHLEPRQYSDYRQNRTLSMISQTAGTTLPSAPTAKELDAMSRYENPFEQEDAYGSSQHYVMLEENENEISDSPISSPIMRPPSSRPQQLSQTSQTSFSSGLPPPPAYTPSATPSAPPLYALPANRAFNVPQPQQQQIDDSHDSLRRHSISSCSITSSSTRPLSLRRGSGSLAHISSPFS